MNVAERIIAKFGGLSPLSQALGHKHPTTVQGWKERGIIPAHQQPKVLAAAHTLKLELSHADFFPEMESDAALAVPSDKTEAA